MAASKRLIHELHAVLLAHLQLARDLVRLIGHDELADGLGEHHDLADRARGRVDRGSSSST